MRDSNGYVTKNLSGRKNQSPITRQVKCEISFPHELQRVTTLMNHDSLTLDHETRSSVSLMVRRALVLLSEHQQTLVTPLDIQEERMVYRWMAKTGNPARVNG
jgi:hypothetical protein